MDFRREVSWSSRNDFFLHLMSTDKSECALDSLASILILTLGQRTYKKLLKMLKLVDLSQQQLWLPDQARQHEVECMLKQLS